MFESTLEARNLTVDGRRTIALATAVVVHAAVLVAAIAASALAIPPVRTPELPPKVSWVVVGAPDLGAREPEPPKPPAPLKGVRDPGGRSVPSEPRKPPAAPPASTPDRLGEGPTDEPDSAGSGEGTAGDPNGRDDGVEGGEGTGLALPGPGADERPIFVGPGVTEPVLLRKVEPAYPAVARLARITGKVVLRAVIGLDGGVESAEIVSSTSPLFEGEALAAVRRWRYRPATMNGQPVRAYFTVAVEFVLR